mmetsp:Transcript_34187/g.77993  ORF Transcript_34187/g.77993 Transcript_34187/m.77993 type:complete len:199 (+) Transcript_34187:34-630(+)
MPRHFLVFADSDTEVLRPDASFASSQKLPVAGGAQEHRVGEVNSSFLNVDSPAVAFANLQARTKARVEHWQQAWEDLQYTYIWNRVMRKLQKHAKAEAFLLGGLAGGVALLAASGSSDKQKKAIPAQDIRLSTRRTVLESNRSLASARRAPSPSEAGRSTHKKPTAGPRRSAVAGQTSTQRPSMPTRLQQIAEESDSM